MRVGRWGVLLASVLVAVAAALASFNQLGDWDTFQHLAYGRDILRRGGFAPEDPFLFPLEGLPSGAQPSWLGSVLIFLSWRGLGDAGPVAMTAGLAAVIFLVAYRSGLEDDDRLGVVVAALVPTFLALVVFRSRAVARPEMVANLLLVVLLAGLRRAGRVGWWWAPALALGIPFWANVHQSVLAGLGVLLVYLLVNGALIAIGRRDWAEWTGAGAVVPIVAGTAAGIALTGFFTPVGFLPFWTPFVVFEWIAKGAGAAAGGAAGTATGSAGVASAAAVAAGPDPTALFQAAIGELQPMGADWLGPFGALVLLAVLAIVAAWRRPNLRELLTALAFVLVASRLRRLSTMAALVLLPVTVQALRAAADRLEARFPGRPRWTTGVAIAASLAAIAYGTADVARRSEIRFGPGLDRRLPIRAVDYLRAIGFEGRAFDTLHFGGFLEWMLDRKVYQDGRGNVRPGEMQAALLGPASPSTFRTLDDRYRFDALVVEYPRFEPGARAALQAAAPSQDWGASPDTWALVAFDDGGQVYLRRDGRYAPFAARDEFRFARPSVPASLASRDGAPAIADYQRAVREAPDCMMCKLRLGLLYLESGRPDLAEPLLEAARDGLPATRMQADYGLARVAASRGDLPGAERRLRSVVESAADPAEARRSLAAVVADQGRTAEALAILRPNLEGASTERADLGLALELARRSGEGRLAAEMERRLRASGP